MTNPRIEQIQPLHHYSQTANYTGFYRHTLVVAGLRAGDLKGNDPRVARTLYVRVAKRQEVRPQNDAQHNIFAVHSVLTTEPLVPSAPGSGGLQATQNSTIQGRP